MKLPLLMLAALALQFHPPVVIAEPAATGQTVPVTLDLADGSRLIGDTTLATLPVRSESLGKLQVPLPNLRTLMFSADHETVNVTLANGDQLQGSLSTVALTLRTRLGEVKIPMDRVTLITAGIAPAPLVPVKVLAGPITNPANDHRYYLLTESTWTAAETAARRLGGHLATIRNPAENAWVYVQFSQQAGVNRGLWIGLSDTAQPGTYVWASGETTTYWNWGHGEPSRQPQEHYVHIFWPGDGREPGWNDMDNISSFSGIPLNGVVEVSPTDAAAQRSTATPVMLDLLDGSHLIGTAGTTPLVVRATFGKVKIELSSIQSIKFTGDRESVVINLRNTDKVTGFLELVDLPVETLLGKLTVPLEQIHEIQF